MDLHEKYPHLQFKRHWKITEKTLYNLGQCKALINAISGISLQPDYYKSLLNVSLIKGARATTAIEGNTLTEKDIENIQKGQSMPPSKEYQEIEVKNIIDSLNKLLVEVVIENKVKLITSDLIKKFHKMVGMGLGEHFDAIPGKFRTDSRIVGTYRTLDYEDAPVLVDHLCDWLKNEFIFSESQHFVESIIQAIVTHVYIEWIHPFGDGNGRTGRLLEFYILLRAGTPDIASHILSNFYNETRPEYYRQFNLALENRDLTKFIDYAVQGYTDGLMETFNVIQGNLFEMSWQKYIYDSFAVKKYMQKKVLERKRTLILELPLNKSYSLEQLVLATPLIARYYGNLSQKTVQRDINELIKMNLIVEEDKNYRANIDVLMHLVPVRKS
jgi:Fic family protein